MARPILLLLPGMLCDRDSWGSVRETLVDLADIRVVGYGLADTIDAMADRVLAEAPERFAVAGHSMGGRVALAVQHAVAGRVIGLGLFGTSCEGHADEAARAREAAMRREQIALAERIGLRGFAETSWLQRMILPERCADVALVGTFLDMVERQGIAVMRAHANAGLTRADRTAWLPAIACPTLVLAGESDAGRPPSVHRDMAARIPGAQLALIPRAGHMVMMERPAEVAATMRGWLGRVADAG